MRYFLFSYTATAKNGSQAITGNIMLDCSIMPSNKLLKDVVIPAVWTARFVTLDQNSIVIGNIVEFKNEEDYKHFCDESDIPNHVLESINFR